MLWFKKLNLDAFLDDVPLVGRHAKTIEYEVQRDDGNVTILIQHELGPRYSPFMSVFMEEAVREVVGVPARCQAGRNSVVVRFAAR